MGKVYVAEQADFDTLTARVTNIEENPVPGPPGPPGMANIYVQQTDPGAVAVNSIWFQTDASGNILAMNVMVP